MSNAQVELTVRSGEFGEKATTVVIPLSSELLRELQFGVELSDKPFSLLLASPGFFGGRGDAHTIRRKVFAMRRAVAEEIARAAVPALMEAFGVNDETDGYRKERP